jgi:hypothetical protein
MVHSNVIEKNLTISCQNDILKRKTTANYHLRLQCQLLFAMRRGRWRQWPVVVSVGQDINWPVDDAQQCN